MLIFWLGMSKSILTLNRTIEPPNKYAHHDFFNLDFANAHKI